ncbi:arabinosidase [Filimonas lacunae]|nr:arabinosidase [Filimonas lacunae]
MVVWHLSGAYAAPPVKQPPYSAYLFAYFTGNDKSEEQICFALSKDGYHYQALNNGQPVLSSAAISETGGVRDPHVIRSADGKAFYMVATDMVSANGWSSNRGLVLLKSTDLIHWTSSRVNIQRKYHGQEQLKRVWAPQTIYDDSAKKYLVYFSLQYGNEPDKICYAYANKDFTDLEGEPKQLFYPPDNIACIDGDIVHKGDKYYLFFKTEGSSPGIKIAVSHHLTYGYTLQNPHYVQQTKNPVEGAGTFILNDGSGYILMYDMYTSGRYQFTRTTDFETFTIMDHKVFMNFHPRHGTVMPVTTAEARRLAAHWLLPAEVITSAQHPAIQKFSTVLDTVAQQLTYRVTPGTNLSAFNPQFTAYAGVTITPAGPQDFTKGPVSYTVVTGHKKQTYRISIQ